MCIFPPKHFLSYLFPWIGLHQFENVCPTVPVMDGLHDIHTWISNGVTLYNKAC